jgi:hypothetical protein
MQFHPFFPTQKKRKKRKKNLEKFLQLPYGVKKTTDQNKDSNKQTNQISPPAAAAAQQQHDQATQHKAVES